MRRSRALQRQTTTTFSFCSGAPMNAPHSTLFQVTKWPRRFAKTITGGWQPRGVRADNTKIIPSANFETLLVRTWSVGTYSGLNSPNPPPRLTVLRRVNPASNCASENSVTTSSVVCRALMVKVLLTVWCCLPRGQCAAWLPSGDWCRLIDLLVH